MGVFSPFLPHMHYLYFLSCLQQAQLNMAQSQLSQAVSRVREHEDEYHQILTLLKQAEARGDEPAKSFLQVGRGGEEVLDSP